MRQQVRAIVEKVLDGPEDHGLPIVTGGRRKDVARRTAESAARSATIIALAVRAGWRVRFFSYTAAQHVTGLPPYMVEGNPGEFTIVNAREVQVSWTGLGDGALLLMASGYLTVQNRRSLVGLASAAGVPRALLSGGRRSMRVLTLILGLPDGLDQSRLLDAPVGGDQREIEGERGGDDESVPRITK